MSAAIGFFGGLCESLLRVGYQLAIGRVPDPDLWVNWHTPWLAPLGQSVWFFGFGILISLIQVLSRPAALLLARFALPALAVWSIIDVVPGLDSRAVWLLVAGATFRLGTLTKPESPSFQRFLRKVAIPGIGCWLVLAIGFGAIPATAELRQVHFGPKATPTDPNVLLVVLDTVRADNMSVYGYARETTPHLATLAQGGVLFTQARSTTPYTLGTHASLFTGLRMSDTSARANAALDTKRRTLAEQLSERGYRTAGFVGNIFYGSARYGIDRGMAHYFDIPENITRQITPHELLRASRLGGFLLNWLERKWHIFKPMQRQRFDAAQVNEAALAWLDRTQQGHRPFFMFVNYFDAHGPYSLPAEAPQPFATNAPREIERKFGEVKRLRGLAKQGHQPELAKRIEQLRGEAMAQSVDVYDDGICWIDHQLDLLLGQLKQRGLLENTLVVVTADHGEMLGEHGLYGHGHTLHRKVVHVPLIMAGPGIPPGKVVHQPVSVRDVSATILDQIGDHAGEGFPGTSLKTSWLADTAPTAPAKPVLTELEHMPWMKGVNQVPAADGPMWLLTDDRFTYMRHHHDEKGTLEWLFDIKNDPEELHDLANDPEHRAALDRLRQAWGDATHVNGDILN